MLSSKCLDKPTEWMYVLEAGESFEDGRKLFRKGLLCIFDLASIKSYGTISLAPPHVAIVLYLLSDLS